MTPAERSDIAAGGWIDRWVPAPARPYLLLSRLDRPIGTWLLLIPCWWGLALAPRPLGFGWSDLWYALLFAVGAVVMRGAGCTVNDILDRDFDAQVARTRSRPLPSGAIGVRDALIWLAAQLAIGLVVLILFPWPVVWLGAASLVLVFLYPLMKRITWWPQAFLGLAFNWGVLLGWTAADGGLRLPAVLLYAAGIAWTLGYDTIYARQDIEDDARIGVKSTARLFDAHAPVWVAGFYAATVLLALAAIIAADLSIVAVAGLVAAAAHLAWQLRQWSLEEPATSLAVFRSNRDFALILLAALLAGRALT
jgi:4-hydroxybenzoate polyprenyltransferase